MDRNVGLPRLYGKGFSLGTWRKLGDLLFKTLGPSRQPVLKR
jgi:hypothetical protein